MQPFAHLPQKTKVLGRTPLDIKGSQVKWKSVHERIGTIHRRVYSSDNKEEESDFPKGSNKEEVKEDVDYRRVEGKIGKLYLYMFCNESICK
jgi:hypothetical protein